MAPVCLCGEVVGVVLGVTCGVGAGVCDGVAVGECIGVGVGVCIDVGVGVGVTELLCLQVPVSSKYTYSSCFPSLGLEANNVPPSSKVLGLFFDSFSFCGSFHLMTDTGNRTSGMLLALHISFIIYWKTPGSSISLFSAIVIAAAITAK